MARYIAVGIWVRTIEVEATSETNAFDAAFHALNDKPTKKKAKKLGLGFSNWHVHKIEEERGQ